MAKLPPDNDGGITWTIPENEDPEFKFNWRKREEIAEDYVAIRDGLDRSKDITNILRHLGYLLELQIELLVNIRELIPEEPFEVKYD